MVFQKTNPNRILIFINYDFVTYLIYYLSELINLYFFYILSRVIFFNLLLLAYEIWNKQFNVGSFLCYFYFWNVKQFWSKALKRPKKFQIGQENKIIQQKGNHNFFLLLLQFYFLASVAISCLSRKHSQQWNLRIYLKSKSFFCIHRCFLRMFVSLILYLFTHC